MFAVFFGFKLLIDSVSPEYIQNPLFPPLAILGSYLFFEYVSRFVYYTVNQYMLGYIFRSKFQNTLNQVFITKMSELDFANIEDPKVRNLIAKVQDNYTWRIPDIVNSISYIINNVASVILSLLVALQFDIRYFLILTLLSLPMYYLRIKYGNASWSLYGSNAPEINKLWYLRGLFLDPIVLSEIKLYNLKSHFIEKTKKLQSKLLDDYQKPIVKYSYYSLLFSLLIPIAMYFPLKNFMVNFSMLAFTIGDFTFLLNTIFNFTTQLSNLLVNVGQIYENSLYLDDFATLLSIENKVKSPHNAHRFTSVKPRDIIFENVTFTYPGNKKPSLENINLTIEKGTNVAIVGENGAGKTTLIKLLLRFYDPQEGRILVDGTDLRTINIDDWYEHIGVLFQNFAHYYLSFQDNITLGDIKKNPTRQEIVSYIKAAQAQDLLTKLPQGLQQMLGKRFDEGQDLSTGEWQKVAIARALYRGAPCLILDEPTANIDAEAESKIFDNLIKQYKSRSLLFISHRFSTVRHAHRIIVMHKGRVQSIGTHKDLLNDDGLYKRFFNLQKKGYES